MINFTIKTLESANHHFSVEDETTVAQLKEQIRNEMGIEIGMQRLIFCGRVLTDEKRLADCNVHGKVIHLVPRPPPSPRSRATEESSDDGPRAGTSRAGTSRQRLETTRTAATVEPPSELVLDQQQNMALTPVASRLEFIRRICDDIRTSLIVLDQVRLMGNRSQSPSDDDTAQATSSVSNTEGSTPPLPMDNNSAPMEVGIADEPSTSEEATAKDEDNQDESVEASQPPRPDSGDTSEESDGLPAAGVARQRRPMRPSDPVLMRPRDLAALVDEIEELRVEFAPFRAQYLEILRDTNQSQLSPEEAARGQTIVQLVCDVMHSFAHALHAVSDIDVTMGEYVTRLSPGFASNRSPLPVRTQINVVHTTARLQPEAQVTFNAAIPIPSRAVNTSATPLVSGVRSANQAPGSTAAQTATHQDTQSARSRNAQPQVTASPESITYQVEARVPLRIPVDSTFINDLAASLQNGQNVFPGTSQAPLQSQAGQSQSQSQSRPGENQGQGEAQGQAQAQGGQDQGQGNRPRLFMDIENLVRTISQAHPGMDVVMSMEEVHPLGSPISMSADFSQRHNNLPFLPTNIDAAAYNLTPAGFQIVPPFGAIPFGFSTTNNGSANGSDAAQNGSSAGIVDALNAALANAAANVGTNNAAAGTENQGANQPETGSLNFGTSGFGAQPRFTVPGFPRFNVGIDGTPGIPAGVGVTAYGPTLNTTLTLQPDGAVLLAPMNANNSGEEALQNMFDTLFGPRLAQNASSANIYVGSSNIGSTITNAATTTAAPIFTFSNAAPAFSASEASVFSTPNAAQTFSATNATPIFSAPGAPPIFSATNAAPTFSVTTAGPTFSATNAVPSFTATNAIPNGVPNNVGAPFTVHSHITYNLNPEIATSRPVNANDTWGIVSGQEVPNVIYVENAPASGAGERSSPTPTTSRRHNHGDRRRADRDSQPGQRPHTNVRAHQLAMACMQYDRFLPCDSIHARHRLAEYRTSYQELYTARMRERNMRTSPISIYRLEQMNYSFTARHMACMMRLLSGPISPEGRLNAFMVTVARNLFLESSRRSEGEGAVVAPPREFPFVRVQMREYLQRVVQTAQRNSGRDHFELVANVIIGHNQAFLDRLANYTSINPLADPALMLRDWLRARIPRVIACVMSDANSETFVARFYAIFTKFYTDLCGMVMLFCTSGFEGFRVLYTAFIDYVTENFEETAQEWVRLISRENLLAIQRTIDPHMRPSPTGRSFFSSMTPPLPLSRNDTPDTPESFPLSVPTMSSSSSCMGSPAPPEPDSADEHSMSSVISVGDTSSPISHQSAPRSPMPTRSAETSPPCNPLDIPLPDTPDPGTLSSLTSGQSSNSEENNRGDLPSQIGHVSSGGSQSLTGSPSVIRQLMQPALSEPAILTCAKRDATEANIQPSGSSEHAELQMDVETMRMHWDDKWLPLFTRDQRLQRERDQPQEPHSDAYLSGMPSRKRRCVRAARPSTTLDGFISETVREASEQTSALDTAQIQSHLLDSVRSMVRTRAEASEDYDPVRYAATARFLDQAPLPTSTEPTESDKLETEKTEPEKMESEKMEPEKID